ncbi:lipid A Kdo2 1-phosphate O-methyltransferase [Desulfovibrionales bacterium]
MALQEEFERSGQWLFRWRSYFPLVWLGLVFIAMGEYSYPGGEETLDHLWEVLCLSISFFGMLIRAYTIGQTPKGTSGRNTSKQIAHSLNTTGAYSVVRNPLYLGNFFMGLGITLFAHLWWLVLLYLLIFWIYYERIIFAEETFLRNKFGDQYLQWAEHTPVIVPNFRNYIKSELSFSFKNVLLREYNGFFAVIVCMFSLEVLGDWIVEQKLKFDTGWLIGVVAGFFIWITLRFLKKRTKLLDVEGR